MFFVGIITDKKNESLFLNYLNSKISENIITINKKNINNIKSIKFDTILINKKIFVRSEILEKIIANSNNLIINSDLDIRLNIIPNSKTNLITYGFNPKSTVTASSLENDDALICIQRNIKNINNYIIEPQEIRVEKLDKNNNPYIIMGTEILTLLYNS